VPIKTTAVILELLVSILCLLKYFCGKMKLLICLAFLFLSAGAEKARFDNYRLYSVQIENNKQYEAMKYLEEHSDSVNYFLISNFCEILKFCEFFSMIFLNQQF
jgi:hypothetical protein